MRALLFALLLAGCASEEPEPAQSLTDKQCVEGGKIYKVGESWACSDGCNTCKCREPGGIEQTTMECDAAPPFMVDSATPADVFVPPDTAVADASGG